MTHGRSDRAAFVLGMSAVVLWSTVATAFKLSLRYLDVLQLLLYSSLTAALCLYAILLSQGRHRGIWRLQRRDYLRSAALGLLNPLCYYVILFKAYALLPAQVAQALNYTWAIMLMVLSVPLLGHRVSLRDGLGALVCYSGVVIVCLGGRALPGGSLSGFGIALALASTVIWSLYWIYKTRDPLDPVTSLFLSFLFSLPFTATACWAFSSPAAVNPGGLLGAAYVGLFEMGVTYVLWLLALRRAQAAARVSTLIFLSPFLSLVFIQFVVGETIAPTTLGGLVLIAAGMIAQRAGEGNWRQRRRATDSE